MDVVTFASREQYEFNHAQHVDFTDPIVGSQTVIATVRTVSGIGNTVTRGLPSVPT